MVFSSFEFLCLFLPLTLAAFWLAWSWRGEVALWVLLVASLAFYGFDNRVGFAVMLAMTASTFMVVRSPALGARRAVCAALIMGLLGCLAYFKYGEFILENLRQFTGLDLPHREAITLPIGISFYTFTLIAVTVDVFKRKVRVGSFRDFLLFVTFFPHLVAGPIVHYRDLGPQLSPATVDAQTEPAKGLLLFAMGLAMKVLVADHVAGYVDGVFDAGVAVTFRIAWAAALAYSVQIYFDFGGYSLMAVGLALFFGLRLPFNFASPYQAASIIEFWRRWNITLSHFLRDYVYIPLGGNQFGALRRHANLMLTMLIGGLWHGANWTFVAWGGLHGAYLVANHVARGRGVALPVWAARGLTMLAVVVAWVFFRSPDFATAHRMLAGMAGLGAAANDVALPRLDRLTLAAIVGGWAIALFAPNAQTIVKGFRPSPLWMVFTAALLSVALLTLLYTGRVYQFIYFRF